MAFNSKNNKVALLGSVLCLSSASTASLLLRFHSNATPELAGIAPEGVTFIWYLMAKLNIHHRYWLLLKLILLKVFDYHQI